jgi:eukaryotic-like serine/threonine-protein kinase
LDAALGAPFMVLELLTGSDVAAELRAHGPLPVGTALRVVAQAALGLHKAHERGVVHRDIKSANLFLCDTGGEEAKLKILDFGIAKVLRDELTEAGPGALTGTGAILGSPRYISPEQVQGLKSVDHRADIWSLGAVLYELLSGQTPYEGAASVGHLVLMLRICSEAPPSLLELAPWVPPEVARIVQGCLRHDPRKRYPTARALASAVAEVLGEDDFRIARSAVRALSAEERAARCAAPLTTHPGAPLVAEASLPSSTADSSSVSGVPTLKG